MTGLLKPLPGLASLKWTPLFMLLFGLGAVGAAMGLASPTVLVAVPLFLLVLNLLSAILMKATFRAQPGLLIFHVALLCVVLLAGASRLTYLKGWVELADQAPFPGELTGVEKGPLHWGALDRVRFVNEGFETEYGPHWRYRKTRNRVRWMGDDRAWHPSVIGDDISLLLHGYRFYTSSNQGFAPVFVWHPADGSPPVKGSVHLPAFPRFRDQSNQWTLPGTELALLVMLVPETPLLSPTVDTRFPSPLQHRLRVTEGGESHDLAPGERFRLSQGGELLYLEMGFWMGYRVFYDWTRSWLLAAFLIAAGSISWHFWKKFSTRSVFVALRGER